MSSPAKRTHLNFIDFKSILPPGYLLEIKSGAQFNKRIRIFKNPAEINGN
jgi:hypothetical protein